MAADLGASTTSEPSLMTILPSFTSTRGAGGALTRVALSSSSFSVNDVSDIDQMKKKKKTRTFQREGKKKNGASAKNQENITHPKLCLPVRVWFGPRAADFRAANLRKGGQRG